MLPKTFYSKKTKKVIFMQLFNTNSCKFNLKEILLCFVFLEILCHRYSSHMMSWGTVVALPSFGNLDFSSKYIRQCYMT